MIGASASLGIRLGKAAHLLSYSCWLSLAVAATVTICTLGPVPVSAQVNVTTYHNDIGRTGQNLNETILNTSNVNPTQFGKLFSQPVDGQIYTQPLYLSGITVNGAMHNVAFVATENDSVYAFDADTNGGANSNPLWQASMLSAAHGAAADATTVPSTTVGYDIQPQIGITSTPVIDPSTGTLYVVSASIENGSAVQRLHALDVTTGLEKFGGPIVITASVPGTGNGSVNGTLTFDPLWENQRAGLLLLNGIIWIGFASHGDNGPWHGWIIGYNAATLQQTGAFCVSRNGTGGGVWMSGEGLPADQLDPINKPFGRMFIPTGNGDYTATTPYTNSMDYGDSHLDLDLTDGVPTVTDEFTTNQQATLDDEDLDVASGGLMILPTQTTGSYPHLAVQAGKIGTLYLLNRDNLGGYNSTADQVVQEQADAAGNAGVWSTPAYWNGNVYYWGQFDYLKSFALVDGLLSTAPTESSEEYKYPGATPSISANGTSQGIVWSVETDAYLNPGPSILMAHSASNVATTLYSSDTNTARDSAGNAVKFAVPTVVNGKVYVSTASEVDIYGLLAGVTQTSIPVIAPSSETYTGTLNVAITDSTPNASIYYTTNGDSATTSSTLYTGPITVNTTETVNTIATASGLLTSAQTSATYTNLSQTLAVSFSLPTGTYGTAQTLTLSDTNSNATIYYTTDGSTPTTSSAVYSGPLTIGATETVSAIAVAPSLGTSPVISNTYTIDLGATGISFSEGFAASAGIVTLNGSAQLNDSRLQLTDGLDGEASASWYKTPVSIQTFTNDFTFQLSNPVANGITFTIQHCSAGAAALGGNGSALGYGLIPNSVAIKFDFYTPVGQGTISTGLYTNGVTPTTPAIDLTGTGINLLSGDEMSAHMVYDGATLTMTISDIVTGAVWSTSWEINIPSTIGSNTAYVGFTGATGAYAASQKILTWTFVSSATASGTTATPAISPASGSYVKALTATISDVTAGAIIYYTTNGSTPTTSSNVYSSPISVGASERINAIAVDAGYSNSAAATATYSITAPADTPTFSPGAGTYSSAQTVTISDATAGATIYYTTNGTTPTTSSTVYSGPITVSDTETLNAISVATGLSNSAVGSSAYTIAAVAPVVNFSTGFTSTGLTLVGASIVNNALQLTDGGPVEERAAWFTKPVNIEAFTTDFNFQQTSASADGFTFAIQNSAQANSAVGGNGASLSYGGIGLSVAVKFDLYSNEGEGPNSTGFYTDGAVPTVPAIDMTSSGVNLHSGDIMHAHIVYDETSLTLTLTDTVTGATFTYAKAINIPSIVGADTAYVGFTGATGGLTAIQNVLNWTYTVGTPVLSTAIPVFSPSAGTYSSAQTVTISDSTSSAAIYYTTNGTAPTTSATVYSGPITIAATETLNAIAVATGYTTSSDAAAIYTIGAVPPVINFASGFTSTGLNLLGATTLNSTLELTDGGAGEERAAWFTTPVNIQSFTTSFNFQETSATADGFTFTIQNYAPGIWSVGGNGGDLGYGGIGSSVAVKFDLYSNAGEGTDSTGFYTDGAVPTVPAIDMTSSGVNLHSGDILNAQISYDGTTLTLTLTDTVTNASFTTSQAINISSIVGADTAYVGFTAATGGATAIQQVLNWTYTVN